MSRLFLYHIYTATRFLFQPAHSGYYNGTAMRFLLDSWKGEIHFNID